MTSINNSGILNYAYNNLGGVIGKAAFSYNAGAGTITVTDESTVTAPDTFKIMHVDIYDRFGNKRYGSIRYAGGNVVLSVNAVNKPLLQINVTNGGSSYATAPTISFTGGGGSGATAIAQVTAGVITGIFVTNPGTGYTSAPTVVITPTSGGTAGAATAVVNNGPALPAMNVSDGLAATITLVTNNNVAVDGSVHNIATSQTAGQFDVEK